jgi:hypothetical protein
MLLGSRQAGVLLVWAFVVCTVPFGMREIAEGNMSGRECRIEGKWVSGAWQNEPTKSCYSFGRSRKSIEVSDPSPHVEKLLSLLHVPDIIGTNWCFVGIGDGTTHSTRMRTQ